MAITDKIVTKERLQYFKGKLDSSGYKNVIEKIKVNGTSQSVNTTDKSVNLFLPTWDFDHGAMTYSKSVALALMTEDGQSKRKAMALSIDNAADPKKVMVGVWGNLDTEMYHAEVPTIDAMNEAIEAGGGKINKIKVNGTEQTIDETDKSVNIPIPVTYNGSYSGATTGFRFYGTTDNPSGSEAQTEIYGTSSNEDYLELTHRELEPVSGGVVDLFERRIATTAYVDKKAPSYIATDDDFSIKLYKDGTPHGHQTTISADSTEDRVIFTHQIVDDQGTTALQFTRELTTKDYVDSTFRTEAQVEAAIAAAQTGAFVKVASYDDLPSEGAAGKIYLVPNSGSGQNVYDEYIWCVVAMMAGGGGGESPVYGYEKIGTTAVDLSGYVQEDDLVEITTAEIDAMFA